MKLHRQLNVGLVTIILLFTSCNPDEEDNAVDTNSGVNGSGNNQPTSEHSCGAPNVHNPNISYGTMTDQEGNTYKTVVIGEQEWMAENLNTGVYRNGDEINTGLSNSEWQNTQQGAWAYYDNAATYACPYGKLYNFYACVDPRSLCPSGWHVPSDNDWSELINFLEPSAAGGDIANIVGDILKSSGNLESGNGFWEADETGVQGTNDIGFSALPAGVRGVDGTYFSKGDIGWWWTSSPGGDGAWLRNMFSYSSSANRTTLSTKLGFSVRCLRD